MTGSQISAIIFAVALSAFSFVITYIFVAQVTAKKRQISQRVGKIVPKPKSVLAEMRDSDPEKRRGGKRKSIITNKKFLDVVYNELILADIKMKPEEFGVLWLVLAFVPSGLMGLFGGKLLSSATLAIIGAWLPLFIIGHRKKKRTLAFEIQLADSLIIICNCLRSGLSFQQAMEAIVKEMPPPISIEFGRTLQEMQYGVPLEDALNNMAGRIKSPDLMLTVSAVNIQRQTGGNLSEILEIISETIKERMKIKGDIRTMTAQGRISGLVIGALPVGLGALLALMNPDYMTVLFTDPLGRVMIGVAVLMELTGFMIIKKIVNIKY